MDALCGKPNSLPWTKLQGLRMLTLGLALASTNGPLRLTMGSGPDLLTFLEPLVICGYFWWFPCLWNSGGWKPRTHWNSVKLMVVWHSKLPAPGVLFLVAVGIKVPTDFLDLTLHLAIGLKVIPQWQAYSGFQHSENAMPYMPYSWDKLRPTIWHNVFRGFGTMKKMMK